MRKVIFLHVKCGLSQPKRYTFCKSFLSILSREFHNSLIASVLQKPQNLAPFSEEKIFVQKIGLLARLLWLMFQIVSKKVLKGR